MERGLRPGRFAIVSNGFGSGPAEALRDFLVAEGATVTTVFHPLTPGAGKTHAVTRFEDGACVDRRSIEAPVGAPWSFALDPFVPLRLPAVDVWFGFNCLAAARGLAARRLRRTRKVVYWAVDFVPRRFGRNPATALYDRLDKTCAIRSDLRVELSQTARAARDDRHRIPESGAAPVAVVPMGAWVESAPHVPETAFGRRRVVFLGHLVERQGVGLLLEAMSLLQRRGAGITASVIGGGPLEPQLRARADELGLNGDVTFTGFVRRHSDLEREVADASVAVAPYEPTPETFSRFADPGKLKAYLAAGLPTILTDVPPNAGELVEHGGAEIVPFDAGDLADSIERLLGDETEWRARRAAALDHARNWDWPRLLRPMLETVWP